MKLNWGHKIAIVYTAFVLFMLGMLYKSLQMPHELVTSNYYEEELLYQSRIDAWNNLSNAPFSVRVASDGGLISMQFANLPVGESPSGTVHLYKPDAAGLDEQHALQLNAEGAMHIKPRRDYGRYKVGVRFALNGIDYYTEEDIDL